MLALTGPSNTKILYFTNRSVTPFMSTINKKIGEITLRDFKVLFDRPGFYRFHFKSVDQEFGMVKEEVSILANSVLKYYNILTLFCFNYYSRLLQTTLFYQDLKEKLLPGSKKTNLFLTFFVFIMRHYILLQNVF